MKRCPTCDRTYADDMTTFCLDDGALLSPPFDPAQTLALNQPPATEATTEVLSEADILAASQPSAETGEAVEDEETSTEPVSETEQTAAATSSSKESVSTAAVAPAATMAATAPRVSTAPAMKPARPSGGMSGTTKGLIAAVVAIAFAAGLIVWQVKASRGRNLNLTAQDMALLAKDQDPRVQMQLASSEEARKDFAKNIREVLALSEEARAAGVADKPEVKRQLTLMRSLIVANAYLKQKQKESPGVSPLTSIPQAEVDAFLKEPGADDKFKQFIEDAQGLGLIPAGQQIPDAQLAQIKTQWGQVFVAERQAIKAGLDKDKSVELQLMLQEARVLVNEYGEKELAPKIKASDQEIDDYIAKHPEFDTSKAKAKAEDVLKRARGGEDFAALAKEFSTDPGSKAEGGELGWFGRGKMVKAFEDAAFSLQPGQISDVIESDFGFHIIQVEERGTKNSDEGKPEEQVRARHILIAKGPTDQPNQFGPPQSPREQARAAVEKEKREKLIEEIIKRTKVSVADNFEVPKPEMPPQQPGMPPSGAVPPGMDEGNAPTGRPAPAPKGQTDGKTPQYGDPVPKSGAGSKPSPKR